MKQQELEDRLLRFSVKILDLTEKLPKSPGGIALANQLARSGTAPSLLYGEACAAESALDFVHKMSIALKELRETRMTLNIIAMKQYFIGSLLTELVDECDQLVRIFGSSINTVRRNHLRKR